MTSAPANPVHPIRNAPTKEANPMPSHTMFRVLDALASVVIVVLAVGTGAATAFLNA